MFFSASRERPRIGRIALSLILAAVSLFAIASSASAVTVSIPPYLYGTTEDLCTLDLTPKTATLPTGSQHTVVATVSSIIPQPPVAFTTREANLSDVIAACVNGDISALADVGVNFTVTSGPNAGKTGVGKLDATGKAYFSYAGMTAGTDTIEAALALPDICDSPVRLVEIQPECPIATLTDTATVTWEAPPVPVVAQAAAPDPSVSVSSRKRCVSGKFHVSPTYSNGTVKTSTLFIDSRKVATKTGTSPFTINAKSYKEGKHNVELVTVFTNGKAASKFASFSRCKVRVAARRITPKFTG